MGIVAAAKGERLERSVPSFPSTSLAETAVARGFLGGCTNVFKRVKIGREVSGEEPCSCLAQKGEGCGAGVALASDYECVCACGQAVARQCVLLC